MYPDDQISTRRLYLSHMPDYIIRIIFLKIIPQNVGVT